MPMPQLLIDFCRDFKLINIKALPMAASFTFSIELLAAGIMATHLSDDESYAAASILFQAYTYTVMQLSFSPVPYVGIRISPFFGELHTLESGNPSAEEINNLQLKLGNIFKVGLIECTILAVPAGITLFFSDRIINLLGQLPEVAQLAAKFLKVFSISTPPLAIRGCIGQMLYANDDSKPAMYISGVNFIIGTLLAIWFSMGGLGVQSQGLSGIAWGYNVESYLTAIGSILYISLGKKYTKIPLFSKTNWRDIINELKVLVTIGGPLAFTKLVEVSTIFILSICAGMIGVSEQGTFSYSMQMPFLIFIFAMAFGETISYHIGRLMGSSEFNEASRIAKNGLITTFIFLTPPCLFVNFYPQCLYKVLNISGEQEKLVPKLLPLVLSAAVVQAGRFNVNQVLRVLHDNKGSTMTSIIGLSTGVAVAAILGLETNAALYGIASGLLIGEGVSFIGLLWRWFSRIQPAAIYKVKMNPENAEHQTWGAYFCSFFKYHSHNNEEETVLLQNQNLNSANLVTMDL